MAAGIRSLLAWWLGGASKPTTVPPDSGDVDVDLRLLETVQAALLDDPRADVSLRLYERVIVTLEID